jgi:hypothetical protein
VRAAGFATALDADVQPGHLATLPVLYADCLRHTRGGGIAYENAETWHLTSTVRPWRPVALLGDPATA